MKASKLNTASYTHYKTLCNNMGHVHKKSTDLLMGEKNICAILSGCSMYVFIIHVSIAQNYE